MARWRCGAVLGVPASLGLLFLAPAASAQQRPAIVESLAQTYGLASFGRIAAIRYTFNAEFPGTHYSHSWIWEPKSDQVTYEGKDKSGQPERAVYLRSQLGSQPANVQDSVDPNFLNDNYWLLLPFHVAWDTNATAEDAGTQKLPLGSGSADKVVVKYPSSGGYSPGDTWDLYVGRDGRISEIGYHRGDPKKPLEVTATWTGYKKAGPLLVSADHSGTVNGKPFRLFFTKVAVKLAGSTAWIAAK